MFKRTAEQLLLKPAQQRISMQVLIEKRNHKELFVVTHRFAVYESCQRQNFTESVKFYQEIFYKCRLINTSRQLLLKLPRNKQSFLIQLQFAEHQHISNRFFFKLFMCVNTVFSLHFLSPLQSSFPQRSSENVIQYPLKR